MRDRRLEPCNRPQDSPDRRFGSRIRRQIRTVDGNIITIGANICAAGGNISPIRCGVCDVDLNVRSDELFVRLSDDGRSSIRCFVYSSDRGVFTLASSGRHASNKEPGIGSSAAPSGDHEWTIDCSVRTIDQL